jgi:hypothetical protein
VIVAVLPPKNSDFQESKLRPSLPSSCSVLPGVEINYVPKIESSLVKSKTSGCSLEVPSGPQSLWDMGVFLLGK